MGAFITTFVPYDAEGRTVNLNTEYMFRDDGLKLNVLRFEYYKDNDNDSSCNWFVLTQEDELKMNKYDSPARYKVSELYLDFPVNTNILNAVDDLKSLRDELSQLIYVLTSSRDINDILSDYAYIYLHVDNDKCIGVTVKRKLIFILGYLKSDLFGVIKKLENSDAE